MTMNHFLNYCLKAVYIACMKCLILNSLFCPESEVFPKYGALKMNPNVNVLGNFNATDFLNKKES